jgi:hypothetical protein
MTKTTNTQQAACLTALADHGFASIDDAREANVFFVCHECHSIKTCEPAEGQTREEQRDLLIQNFWGMDVCCEDGDDSIL